jgi:hypothetical protein
MRPVPDRLKRKFFCLRGVHAPNCCSLLWPKHAVLVLRHDLLLIGMLLHDSACYEHSKNAQNACVRFRND